MLCEYVACLCGGACAICLHESQAGGGSVAMHMGPELNDASSALTVTVMLAFSGVSQRGSPGRHFNVTDSALVSVFASAMGANSETAPEIHQKPKT